MLQLQSSSCLRKRHLPIHLPHQGATMSGVQIPTVEIALMRIQSARIGWPIALMELEFTQTFEPLVEHTSGCKTVTHHVTTIPFDAGNILPLVALAEKLFVHDCGPAPYRSTTVLDVGISQLPTERNPWAILELVERALIKAEMPAQLNRGQIIHRLDELNS